MYSPALGSERPSPITVSSAVATARLLPLVEGGEILDPPPALAFRDLLDLDPLEVVVEDRLALLRERRRAVVLLLPDGGVLLAAGALQRAGQGPAERTQTGERLAVELHPQLGEPFLLGPGADEVIGHRPKPSPPDSDGLRLRLAGRLCHLGRPLESALLEDLAHLRIGDELLEALVVPVEHGPDPLGVVRIAEDLCSLRPMLFPLRRSLGRERLTEAVEILDLRRG